ncbi:hypothetical protein DMENIID0001_009510 [Sergentomyia squamirostris]
MVRPLLNSMLFLKSWPSHIMVQPSPRSSQTHNGPTVAQLDALLEVMAITHIMVQPSPRSSHTHNGPTVAQLDALLEVMAITHYGPT